MVLDASSLLEFSEVREEASEIAIEPRLALVLRDFDHRFGIQHSGSFNTYHYWSSVVSHR